MQTAKELRDAAQAQRMRAYAAPNMETQRKELADAEHLEIKADMLERSSEQLDVSDMEAKIRKANGAMRSAQSRVNELETMLSALIKKPVKNRSTVWIAGKLRDWSKS